MGEESGNGTDAVIAERRRFGNDLGDGFPPVMQSQLALVGATIGLTTVAVFVLSYGWIARVPEPAIRGVEGTTALLTRVTWVVAMTVVLVALVLGPGRGCLRRAAPRQRLLAWCAPAIAVVGVGVLLATRLSSVRDLFDAAAFEQLSPDSGHADTAARIAVWSAGLALIALACVAYRSFVKPNECHYQSNPRSAVRTAVVVGTVIVVAGAGAMTFFARDVSPFSGSTAQSQPEPPIPARPSRVVYRVSGLTPGINSPVVAGNGFVGVRVSLSGDTVEGFDGSTGARRWWFSADDLMVSTLRSTGTGDRSVVYFRASSAGLPGAPIIGLDATTGTHLWTRWFGNVRPDDDLLHGRSSNVVLLLQSRADTSNPDDSTPMRWLGVSPRTGDVLWSKDIATGCRAYAYLTDEAVVTSACDPRPGAIANVLDPRTGDVMRDIVVADLPDSFASDTGRLTNARGTLALITTRRQAPSPPRWSSTPVLMNTANGRVVHVFGEDDEAEFAGKDTVLVTRYDAARHTYPVSLYTPSTDRLMHIDVYLPTSASRRAWPRSTLPWVALTETTVGFTAPEPIDRRGNSGTTGLFAISGDGSFSSVVAPCDRVNVALLAAPGAMLAVCPGEIVGLR